MFADLGHFNRSSIRVKYLLRLRISLSLFFLFACFLLFTGPHFLADSISLYYISIISADICGPDGIFDQKSKRPF